MITRLSFLDIFSKCMYLECLCIFDLQQFLGVNLLHQIEFRNILLQTDIPQVFVTSVVYLSQFSPAFFHLLFQLQPIKVRVF